MCRQDGTTALLGLLIHNTLHMGWVGDSRCILSRQVWRKQWGVGAHVCGEERRGEEMEMQARGRAGVAATLYISFVGCNGVYVFDWPRWGGCVRREGACMKRGNGL